MKSGPDLGISLGVWAHPDDETYLSAGVMALNKRLGNRVVCITATRGEEGVQDESRWPRARLGEIRQKEMEAGMAVLGISEHHWLDYRDGACSDVDKEEAVGKVAAWIQKVQPDTVMTFGPDGMTGHPDHSAVSAWTTEAFQRAASPGAKLYYAAMSKEWAERFLHLFVPFNTFPGGSPPGLVSQAEMDILFIPPQEILALKLEAISKHSSQVEHMLKALGEEGIVEAHREESFRLAMVR